MRLIAAASASSLLILVTLMGCSSDDSSDGANPDGGGSSGNPVNPDGGPVGPSGPDGHAYWTKTTNIAHYKVYPDRAAAIAWFTSVQDRGDTGLENDKPVPATDSRYPDVDTKVGEVWKGFQNDFPADTQDLPTPIVVLVDSPKPGAYAVWDPELGLSPNVFMIQTPTLTLGDDAIRGVIAHELAHHVLKHKWPGVSDKIEIWYDATKTVEHGFGFEQTNDAAIKKTGKTAQVYGLSTGDYPLTQWNGATRRGGSLDDFVGYVHVKAKATNAAACADADTAYEAMLAYADPYRDRATSTLTMTPDQLTQLDSLSKTYITKETTCTSVVKDGFFAVIGEALGISESDARAQASPEEIAAADQSTSAFDALVRITKKYDEYMTTTNNGNTRYFSYEEQADDTSIGVLKNLGFAPDGITTYLKKGALDETALAKCNALGTTNEPPYGIISDAHHSTCWRIWHTTKVTAFVNSP